MTEAELKLRAQARLRLKQQQAQNSTMDDVVAGATEFAEGMTGYGTELGAIGQQIGGSVYDLINTDKSVGQIFDDNFGGESFDRAFQSIRQKQDRFEQDHEGLSDAIAVGGMATGLVLPGSQLVKGSKMARTAAVAAEGAVYGAGTDDGDRLEGAAIGAGVGTVAAVTLPKLITKWQEMRANPEATADEIAETGGELLEKQADEISAGGWTDRSKGEWNQVWSEYATGVSDAISRRVSPEVGGRVQRADETAMRMQTLDTEAYLENAGMRKVIDLWERDDEFAGMVLDFARHSGDQSKLYNYVVKELDEEAGEGLMQYLRWSETNNRNWNVRAGDSSQSAVGHMHTQVKSDSVLTGSKKPDAKNKINTLDDDLNVTPKDVGEMDRTRGLASKGEVRVREYQNPFLSNANRIFNNNRILQLAEKFGVKDVSGGPEAVMDAIEQAIKKKGISDAGARDARNAMATLIKGQNKSANAWIKSFQNSGYTVLAGPKTVLLNFHDWPVALWNNGVKNAQGLWRDVSKGGADVKRLGIDGQNVGEFVQRMRRNNVNDKSWGAKAEKITDSITQQAMKLGGFRWADRAAKNGVLRTVAEDVTNRVKAGTLRERWGTAFDPAELDMIEEAVERTGGDWNKMSVKEQKVYDEMLTMGLGQQQLISAAGRPEQWLDNPNLRPLWMMRGFAIKHNALLSDRIYAKMKAGDIAEAAKEASLYMALPGASYAAMNVARNEMFKEDYEASGEEFMFSMIDAVTGPVTLNTLGLGSSYERSELLKNPDEAIMRALIPPTGLYGDSLNAIVKGAYKGDGEEVAKIVTDHPLWKQWEAALD